VDGAVDLERHGPATGRILAVNHQHPGDFLRLTFAFSRAVTSLEAHAVEAQGGALAGSLGLDPRQPFTLDAHARGAPRQGAFTLATSLGATSPAIANGQWSAAGGQASGRLDLTASRWLTRWRAGLGPEATFKLTAARTPAGLYRLALQSRAAKVNVNANGEVDVDRKRTGPGGVAVSAALANVSALAGVSTIGAGQMVGRLTGQWDRWGLSGRGSVQGVKLAGLSLTQIAGPFQVSKERAGLIARAEVQGAGGSGSSPTAVLLGAAPHASGELDWLPGGRMLLRRLTLNGLALDADGAGERGLFGDLSFKGQARIHDLAIASPGARGTVMADWRASQPRAEAPWSFSVTTHAQGLRLTATTLNDLLGPAPTFSASGQARPEGLTLERANLETKVATATGLGAIGADGALRLKFDWTGKGPIPVGPILVTGLSKGAGDVVGTIDRPRLDATADLGAVNFPDLGDLRLRQARLTVSLAGDGRALAGSANLTAVSDQGPAKAAADFQLAPDEIALTGIAIDAGGAALHGTGTLKDAGLALADLTFAIGPGAFITGGHADGTVRITSSGDGPHARVALEGSGIVLPNGMGGFDTLSLTADGPLRRLPYRTTAKGETLGLRGRFTGTGLLTADKNSVMAAFTGAGRIGGADVHTLSPAEIAFGAAGSSGAWHLAVGQGGRADVTFTQSGAALSGRAVVAALDIGLLNRDVVGRTDGVLTFARRGDTLSGAAQAKVTGLAARDLEGATPLAGTIDATFGGGALVLATRLSDAAGSKVAMDVKLPATMSANPLALGIDTKTAISGKFAIDGAIGPIWDLVEGGSQSLTGRMIASGAIGGSLADPLLTGTAAIDNGDFEDGSVGLRLKGFTLRAALNGNQVDVSQFGASDGAKGTLSGSGRLSLLRDGASAFRVGLKGFRLFDNALGQATASGDVNVDRAADGKVRLAGALTIDRAQISPKSTTPSGVVPMDVVEIHGHADTSDFAPEPARRDPPVNLDIGLKAPAGIFIKGRGLNLELSMDARVTGSNAAPNLTGTARVVRGDYDFAGKRFTMDDTGVVRLGSTPQTILLNLTATREDPTLTAVIKIGGTAAAPTITLSSTPSLPNDEILSQVLFGASAAQLSGPQAAQLASTLAGLAGGGGLDVIGGLRGFARLDRLAIDSTAASGFSIAGGKYITDRIYVELSDSAKTGQGAQVEWRLKKHIAIVSRVTSQGDNAVSIRWRRDY